MQSVVLQIGIALWVVVVAGRTVLMRMAATRRRAVMAVLCASNHCSPQEQDEYYGPDFHCPLVECHCNSIWLVFVAQCSFTSSSEILRFEPRPLRIVHAMHARKAARLSQNTILRQFFKTEWPVQQRPFRLGLLYRPFEVQQYHSPSR